MSDVNSALNDLRSGWQRANLWLTLAWDDTRLRYNRSVIGPFWISVGTVFYIAVLSYLWSGLLDRGIATYLPWLAVSITAWRLISGSITDGAQTLVRASNIIQNVPLPLSVHIYSMVTRKMIVYGMDLAAIIPLLAIAGVRPNVYTALFFPGLAIIAITAAATAFILALVGARFRDFGPAVTMLMTPMYFLTPVLWMPEMVQGGRSNLVLFNPFTHYLAIVREPLLGREPEMMNYIVTLSITPILLIVAIALLGELRLKVPYWV